MTSQAVGYAIAKERSYGMCEVCTFRRAGQMQHRRPRGMGGSSRADTHSPANLLHVCGTSSTEDCCHRIIESYRTESFENGWLVRQGVDPATVRVLYRGSWVHLEHNGDITRSEAA